MERADRQTPDMRLCSYLIAPILCLGVVGFQLILCVCVLLSRHCILYSLAKRGPLSGSDQRYARLSATCVYPERRGTNPCGLVIPQLLVVATSGFLACGQLLAWNQSTPTVEQVEQAWESRQLRTRTANFEWKEMNFISKGALGPRLDSNRKSTKNLPQMPPTDITMEMSRSVSFDAGLLRFSRTGTEFNLVSGTCGEVSYVAAFYGDEYKSFFQEGPVWGGQIAPVGFVSTDSRHLAHDKFHDLPILLTYRGCDPTTCGWNLRDFSLDPHKVAVVDGHKCVFLNRSFQSQTNDTFWVDPQRDFIVLRVVSSRPGKTTTVDISYREDPSHGWVPSTWQSVAVGAISGRLFQQSNATITAWEINVDIAPSTFQLYFPTDTVVREGDDTYLVRRDGGRRRITDAEIRRGASYDEMLNTESGQAAIPGNASDFAGNWILVVAISLPLAISVLFLLRRRRKPALGGNRMEVDTQSTHKETRGRE